jgi:hypothetical protein
MARLEACSRRRLVRAFGAQRPNADRQIWHDHAPAVRPFNRSDRWLLARSRVISTDVLRAGLLVRTIDRSLFALALLCGACGSVGANG